MCTFNKDHNVDVKYPARIYGIIYEGKIKICCRDCWLKPPKPSIVVSRRYLGERAEEERVITSRDVKELAVDFRFSAGGFR